MRQATETIGQATRLAGESETALREIVALAQTNALSGQNIVEAAREQSRVAREIAKSSEDVRRIADQTDEGMNTASQALEQLIQMAGALKDLVDRLSA
jgi:methyl-accepting chemotaxis protein